MGNAPKLRFEGFDGEWKKKHFSEITYASGKRNRNNLPLEPYAITNEAGFIPQNEAHDEFGYMKDIDRSAYIIVPPRSFGYNPARINVGSLGYYEGTENVIVSSLYEVFQTTEEIEDEFLLHWFNTPAFQKWIGQLQEGSVRLYFYYDKLCECHVPIPSLDEQEKIGILFQHFDHLITLHQRKHDALLKAKQFYLQNLFPKKGEKVPAIRFAGFEGEWERKLLSEITYASGKRNRDNLDLEPYAITNESGFIPQNEAHDEFGYMKDTDRSAYIIVTPNSFGYNPARINVGSLGYYAGTQDVIVSSLYEVFQTTKEIDDRFLLHWFNTPVFRKWIGQLQEGSVRLYFYYDKLCECHALIPSLGEQEKIADFLSNFDHLLALQSRKLETLKKMKQFMLQNLFV